MVGSRAGLGALAGVTSAAAFALLYQSLAMGPMGVLSPVTAVVSAVVPAAAGLAEGERLSVIGAGIGLAVVAVIAVSAGSGGSKAERHRRPSPAALAWRWPPGRRSGPCSSSWPGARTTAGWPR